MGHTRLPHRASRCMEIHGSDEYTLSGGIRDAHAVLYLCYYGIIAE